MRDSPVDILALSQSNQERAHDVIRAAGIYEAWESVGATVNLVGSLKTGLLMTHRDIDFHIYTPELDIDKSFSAMTRIASCPAIKHIEYTNLSGTGEECLEWHAWYHDSGEIWQIDMINILSGSTFDGYMENVARRITERLTPQLKYIILDIKYNTPEQRKVPGILYYQAVLRDGVKTYDEFAEWLENNPTDGIIEWIP